MSPRLTASTLLMPPGAPWGLVPEEFLRETAPRGGSLTQWLTILLEGQMTWAQILALPRAELCDHGQSMCPSLSFSLTN